MWSIKVLSFSASDDSTPEFTSIHQGFIETASFIFSGLIPPARTNFLSSEIFSSKLQSNTFPVPPYTSFENVSNRMASAEGKSSIFISD